MSKFDAELYSIKSDCKTTYPKRDFQSDNTQNPIKMPFSFKIVEAKKIKWYKSPSAVILYFVQIALLLSVVILILVNFLK